MTISIGSVGNLILEFWRSMAEAESPLRNSHPLEHSLYKCLASISLKSAAFVSFSQAVESAMAGCMAVGGRRKPETRSILVGQSMVRLRSSANHRRLLLDVCTSCSATSCSSESPEICSILASTVDHVWSGGKREGDDPETAPVPVVFPAPSQEEEEKVAYHAGWTFKRVRDELLVSRLTFQAQGRSAVVQCSASEVLDLLAALGQDCLEHSGRYLFRVEKDVADFFHALHPVVQGQLKVSAGVTTVVYTYCPAVLRKARRT